MEIEAFQFLIRAKNSNRQTFQTSLDLPLTIIMEKINHTKWASLSINTSPRKSSFFINIKMGNAQSGFISLSKIAKKLQHFNVPLRCQCTILLNCMNTLN